eukprot:m.24962 g.24962  ORF g.24962 m.24962 type:complete len:239 (+) comp28707_c0_seq2:51-767(+)
MVSSLARGPCHSCASRRIETLEFAQMRMRIGNWDKAEKMGLLTILKKMRQKEKEVRLLMLGLDNAGKTTILKRFNGEDISTISPTLGFNIKTFEHKEYGSRLVCIACHISAYSFKLNVWDVGGQKSLRSYWRNYFESTDGVIWVVDSADKRRLEDCKTELRSLLQEERLLGATLLVFANKQDLPGALTGGEIREAMDLDSIKTHHWNIQWCSAVTGEKLIDGIDWIIDDIASRIFTYD